jgi:hypothetical protein
MGPPSCRFVVLGTQRPRIVCLLANPTVRLFSRSALRKSLTVLNLKSSVRRRRFGRGEACGRGGVGSGNSFGQGAISGKHWKP